MCLGSGAEIDVRCNSTSDDQKDLPFISSASPTIKPAVWAPAYHGLMF
jgi:hypothetical protein